VLAPPKNASITKGRIEGRGRQSRLPWMTIGDLR
jgi:hypothetical protein